MKIITAPRRGGKTTQMLEWMRNAPDGEHRVCVSATQQEAMRLLRENPDLETWKFVSLDEVQGHGGRGGGSGVLYGRGGEIRLGLDNADWMLKSMIPY